MLRGADTGVLDSLFFGDGSDGDVIVSGSAVLSRDMFYKNLTVLKGSRLRTAGYKIKVRETLLVEGDLNDIGVISNNGDNARNSTGTVAEVSSSVPAGTPGGAPGSTGGGGSGGAGMYNGGRLLGTTSPFHGQDEHPSEFGGPNVPAVDRAVTGSFPLGGQGGVGGAAVTGAFGVQKTRFGELSPENFMPEAQAFKHHRFGGFRGLFTAMTAGMMGKAETGPTAFTLITGGTGGGAGASHSFGTIGVQPRSGWGGGGGGIVHVAARNMVLSGTIEARGGRGGNTFGFNGGGGGGGGGVVMLVYSKLNMRVQLDQHIDVSGGPGGIGQDPSIAASSQPGDDGRFFAFEV